MRLVIPEGYVTAAEKTNYLYHLQELLRVKHNEMGEKFRNGQIPRQAWDNFCRDHKKKMDLLVVELLTARASLKNDNSIDASIENDFVED